jgi:DNA sulfur modification protein dndD
MKINRITLFNIGPYADINSFELDLSKEKNIVLIGGKNGAGKTTFFKAIKTCLYGCKVWGFDAPGKEYFSIVGGLMNSRSKYDSSSSAYVEIELYFNDGKQVNIYTLHREWKKNKQTICEYFHVKKNGLLILGQEEDDFINYLLSIIPPDMFNFYFFDGESIAEFFLGADGNKNFRNAFLKLYGLDTLSIMVENFNRHIKKSDSQKSGYDKFLEAKKELETQVQIYESLKNEILEIENKIDLLQIKARALQNNYSKDGGISLAEWKEINTAITKEENTRDNINRWLKEVANHYIPFIIIEKQLRVLLSELQDAQENERKNSVLQTFSDSSFSNALANYLISNGESTINADDLIAYLSSLMSSSEESLNFGFSSGQISRIIAQIYEKLDFDKNLIAKAITQLNASLKKNKQYREQLMSTSVDGYQNFIEEKETIENQLSSLLVLIERKRVDSDNQAVKVSVAEKEFEKVKAAYEELLKNKSIANISERAAATFSLLEEKLVKRQADILQKEFVDCFSSIINKDHFIDGIVIDKKINVIPYKNIDITRRQMDNYRRDNKEFLSLFNNVELIINMNKLEFGEVDSISVPSPITAPFSQGERQVYIMSIYLALLKTSKKDIPFFIDTPFARIDSNHRSNIISEFFSKVHNQMFILSTDEEIIGEYYDMLINKVSNRFLLQINAYGRTKIVSDKYFGE